MAAKLSFPVREGRSKIGTCPTLDRRRAKDRLSPISDLVGTGIRAQITKAFSADNISTK
jgi:hypothetical protein